MTQEAPGIKYAVPTGGKWASFYINPGARIADWEFLEDPTPTKIGDLNILWQAPRDESMNPPVPEGTLFLADKYIFKNGGQDDNSGATLLGWSDGPHVNGGIWILKVGTVLLEVTATGIKEPEAAEIVF